MFENGPSSPEIGKAFDALKTFDAGGSRGALMPIDNAVIASLGDAAARKALERRLNAALQAGGSVVAREYICSKLRLIGEAESAPVLAALLADKNLACAAAVALQGIGMAHPEAYKAVRDRVPTLSGVSKVQAINLLGQCRDSQDIPFLVTALSDKDVGTVEAALAALGRIGTPEAGKAIQSMLPKASASLRLAIFDALLMCAERLTADGKKPDAQAIYGLLADAQNPSHVRAAARRGAALASR